MAKDGLDYFPLNCQLDEKFELIEAEFGLTGFSIVVKLLQRIYGEHGYYCEWTNEVALLFSKKIGLGGNAVSEIIEASIRRGIFSKELYDKYSILTSQGIQKRYLDAVSRRKEVLVKKDYLLINVDNKYKNVSILGEDVDINSKDVNISKQSRVKESKVKESKERVGLALPDTYFANKELDDAFKLFISYRINKYQEQLNLEQITLMIAEINLIADKDNDRIAILKKAIMKGWKNFYPLDEQENKKTTTNKFNNFPQREYDMESLERQLLEADGKDCKGDW